MLFVSWQQTDEPSNQIQLALRNFVAGVLCCRGARDSEKHSLRHASARRMPMPRLISLAMFLFAAQAAFAAEPMFGPECPTRGNMEVIDDPTAWADECFRASNGRNPSVNSGQKYTMDRDIDLDGIPERLESRGVGNRLKQIYVFKHANDTFRYMGQLHAHPEFFVATDRLNQTYLLNIYRAGAGEVYLQYIEYRDGEFVKVREDLMQ
jgi:hypothetical protein